MDKSIFIKDYWYDLPANRIALYPLPERDKSRLLVYKDGIIEHKQFTQINDFLPSQSTLFFNDTERRFKRMLRTGEYHSLEAVRTYAMALARGEKPTPPVPSKMTPDELKRLRASARRLGDG